MSYRRQSDPSALILQCFTIHYCFCDVGKVFCLVEFWIKKRKAKKRTQFNNDSNLSKSKYGSSYWIAQPQHQIILLFFGFCRTNYSKNCESRTICGSCSKSNVQLNVTTKNMRQHFLRTKTKTISKWFFLFQRWIFV